MLTIPQTLLVIIFSPLVGCLIAGLFRKQVGRIGAHCVTILGVLISFVLSFSLAQWIFMKHLPAQSWNLYTWISSGNFSVNIGFLLDPLSALMLVVVTFVSLLVHVYSIGYMSDDPGYQRFFSYISLFTFCMLMLVLGNNFLVLFFGWEGVGLVSYLLIGFWYKKESAIQGSLKAFVANRFGDFGFVLGIGAVLTYFGTLDYASVFAMAPALAARQETMTILPHLPWSVPTVICLLLFVGAMGKSAQVPLHVWLPESMEGPTPISALIHAATMVTAGIYMVARMSPLYELSPMALSVILVIGATGALFLGLLGIVQTDIKRVVAYSTLSQLGYMVAALGASAFNAAIFHLFTHAFFKALLFLGAGSVIVAMHHEQDLRKMGGLYKYMPITYITFLLGSLSLSAIPPFAGFYSKDAIIEAVHLTTIPGASYAYFCVVCGSFVTAFYSFRAFFLAFHTKPRMDHHTQEHLHESPWTIWLPLVLLAIPSVLAGWYFVSGMLYSTPGMLGSSIYIADQYNVMSTLAAEFHGPKAAMFEAVKSLPFWLAIAGVFAAWFMYVLVPSIPEIAAKRLSIIYNILLAKYGFDKLNDFVIVRGGRCLGNALYKFSDLIFIDGLFVNGSGIAVAKVSRIMRRLQTGYLYHYVFIMVLGVVGFLAWLMLKVY